MTGTVSKKNLKSHGLFAIFVRSRQLYQIKTPSIMKRILLFLAAAFALSFGAAAQNHVAIQAVPHFAPENDWSTSSVEFNVQYVRDLGKVFHLGAGVGVGTGSPVKYHSGWDLEGTEKREHTLYLPVFVRGKVDFGTKRSHPYFAFKAGTKLCSVEGYDGQDFNPFVANLSPAIGYDIALGDHKLGIELVVDSVFGRYQEIHYAYNDVLKKYVYDSFVTASDSIWAGFGVAVTFEF